MPSAKLRPFFFIGLDVLMQMFPYSTNKHLIDNRVFIYLISLQTTISAFFIERKICQNCPSTIMMNRINSRAAKFMSENVKPGYMKATS